MKKMLSVKEVACELGVCEMTIYRQVKSKHIPSKRVGRAIRIPYSFINDMVENPITDTQKFIFG